MSLNKNELIESLSCENNYITRNRILEYLNDSVEQLLDIKNIDPKIDVLEFFTEYFKTVLEGNHILYRDFNFVSSTPYNRACFIQKFFELFCQLLTKEVDSFEIHSLLMLMCVNFPKNLVDESFKIMSRDDSPKLLFKDFIYLFQLQFYYNEFIQESKKIYDDLMTTSDCKTNENKKKFLDKISVLIKQSKFECPSTNLLSESFKKILCNNLEFYEFLVNLAFNENIIKHIGKLPSKNELIDYEKRLINNENGKKEANEPILNDKLNVSNLKSNDLKQKSLSNISNCTNKESTLNQIKHQSSSDSSSDTDT